MDVLGLSDGSGTYPCDCDRTKVNQKIAEMSRQSATLSQGDLNMVPANIRSVSHGREYGGRICCDKTSQEISSTGPVPGRWKHQGNDYWTGESFDTSLAPQCTKGTEVADYHSHPSGSARFSSTDRNWVQTNKLPLGVGTLDGDTSLMEPVLTDVDEGYGTVHDFLTSFNGWSINSNGSLSSSNVIPNYAGTGYTSSLNRTP